MKILKNILLGLLSVVVLLMIISFFLPDKVHLERKVSVNAPPSAIYNIVNTPASYDEWMPWNKLDPGMKKEFFGPGSGSGAGYSWESDRREVGHGSLKITETKPHEYVKTYMDFKENGDGTGAFILTKENDRTIVTWTMDSESKGNFFKSAIGRYMGLFMDKMVGPSFEQGLADIKRMAESSKTQVVNTGKEPTIHIIETIIEPTMVIVKKGLTANSIKEIGEQLGKAYGDIGAYLQKNKLMMKGSPMAWYDGGKEPYKFVAGIPVHKKTFVAKEENNLSIKELRGGKAVVAHFFGPYELMSKGYEAVAKWMKDNSKDYKGFPYEIYVTDPVMEKDPGKWQTDIVFPLL